jgi:predicted P-loop ATPase
MSGKDNIDIDAILAERRQIAIIWSIEDVKEKRPDLDEDQCWEVLKRCEKVHNYNYGFTWHLIESVAEFLFGDAPEREDGRVA